MKSVAKIGSIKENSALEEISSEIEKAKRSVFDLIFLSSEIHTH
jgi:hypothetical protein